MPLSLDAYLEHVLHLVSVVVTASNSSGIQWIVS